MTGAAQPPRVLVYGSCVARDTVEAAGDRIDLRGYVARQSLLSAGSDASAHLPEDLGLESSFQARMVRADFAGLLPARLEELADGIDLLLWDLADERHGVHRFSDGTFVTRSIDTIRSEAVAAVLDEAVHLPFGDDGHFALWRERATRFVEELRRQGLLERTVVLEVPWALRTTEGAPTPWSMGVRAGDANARFARYYATLHDLGVRTIALPPESVLADPGHRWGLAPFHYAPGVYAEVLRRLQDEHGVDGVALPS